MVIVLSEPKREFITRADDNDEALKKVREMVDQYPEESMRYVAKGFRLVDAVTVQEAKKKFNSATITDLSGQIKFI